MRNIAAIARREIGAYFASPIAYVVIGFFALRVRLVLRVAAEFLRPAEHAGWRDGHDQPVNVNQQLIRPLLQNAAVIILFVLPMITMRTYSEEKRSGTIELLLTSPLTDWQIIVGKFLGALALYAAMLGVTLIHIAVLFVFGTPEWKPIVTGYLGLLLLGSCFLSVGLFISSMTRNQIVAGMVTFGVFLLLWVIDWIGAGAGPTVEKIVGYLSITEHLDDFAKGVIDTRHLVYYLSFITFGLFLTAKSVDSERWRG